MKMFLIPREGVLVRQPSSYTPLPVEGAYVSWDGNAGRFWRRRVKQGDVTIGEPKKEAESDIVSEPLQKSKRSK